MPTPRKFMARMLTILAVMFLVSGCVPDKPPQPYGREATLFLPDNRPRVWGIGPVINLSGEEGVDSLIQADLLYQQLQPVPGVTVVPVDRVVAVYQALHIAQVDSEDQAKAVCEALGLDGLMIATVTAYDPYNPPKFGVSLQLFQPHHRATANQISAQDLARESAPSTQANEPEKVGFAQVVGTFDVANGSVRDRLKAYAAGRYDPQSPLGGAEYYLNMDRYCGFVYHELLRELFQQPQLAGH
jgi:hypothetical protein